MTEKETKGTILVVDDEEFVLSALERSLKRAKFRVITCQDPTKVMDILEEEPVEVIISDERMPEMSGMELLVDVRKKHPSVVRILLTGHASVEVAITAVNEGKLYRFLTKPWDDEELRELAAKAVQVSRVSNRSRQAIKEMKNQEQAAEHLEKRYPGISRIKRDKTGAIILDD